MPGLPGSALRGIPRHIAASGLQNGRVWLKLAQRLIEEGKAASEIADTFNVHVATIYRLAAALDAFYPKTPTP